MILQMIVVYSNAYHMLMALYSLKYSEFVASKIYKSISILNKLKYIPSQMKQNNIYSHAIL